MMYCNAKVELISILKFQAMCSANQNSITTCFDTSMCFIVDGKLIEVVSLDCSKYLAKTIKMEEQEKMHGRKWLAR